MDIDITFDFRSESNGKDADSHSKTLKQYHKFLWSKKLPNGKEFILTDNKPNAYLYHKSDLGEYCLSSDSFIHPYDYWKRMKDLINQIPKENIKIFDHISNTIGSIIIFPSNRINGLYTMNQERGTNKYINDRFDLTLECIRRYFNNENSPLFDTIKRYCNFFHLFDNFKGYCEYFLLQELVEDNYTKIKFFLPFNDFIYNILPKDVDEYNEYMKNSIEFVVNRNNRIIKYLNTIQNRSYFYLNIRANNNCVYQYIVNPDGELDNYGSQLNVVNRKPIEGEIKMITDETIEKIKNTQERNWNYEKLSSSFFDNEGNIYSTIGEDFILYRSLYKSEYLKNNYDKL